MDRDALAGIPPSTGTGYPSDGCCCGPRSSSPPFGDEIAFRVTGDGNCTELLAEPHRDADIAACLPDGSRVMLAVPPLTTHAAENGSACLRDCYDAALEQATPPMGCRGSGSACKRETASKAGSRKSTSPTTSDATREASVASMTSANPGRVAAKPNVACREGFELPTPSSPNWRSCAVAHQRRCRGLTSVLDYVRALQSAAPVGGPVTCFGGRGPMSRRGPQLAT